MRPSLHLPPAPPRRRSPTGGAGGPAAGRRAVAGFTLVELMIVIVIIGIIVGLVLVASAEGVRRAEQRATEALIAKLDMGVTERLNALMSQSVTPNGAHEFLAAIHPPGTAGAMPWGLPSADRARVIARLDALRAEMPDFFVVQDHDLYPLNFGGIAYPAEETGDAAFLLPLGHLARAYRYDQNDPAGDPWAGPGDNDGTNTSADSTGIYGASWAARAAFNKLLGFPPAGYNMIDDDRNGLVDEFTRDELFPGNVPDKNRRFNELRAEVLAKLANHDPRTARAEALYAMLVEGIGPLGSVFSPDEFTEREVRDTDGDGLPEFVDAWGEPLQFYRWPLYYPSPIQKGVLPYTSPIEPRQTSPLDPNNTLVAPAWWIAAYNGGGDANVPSASAGIVMQHFVSLMEPSTDSDTWTWDRSGATPRRAYFSRPLILSGGPDRVPGVTLDPAAPLDALRFAMPLVPDIDAAAFDDITNQTLQQPGGGGAQ